MTSHAEEMLGLMGELRALCARPAAPEMYEQIERITQRLQHSAAPPIVAALALDVQFKAQDVFRGPQLMPEAVLREMLRDRLHRLEATLRASLAQTPAVPLERRNAGAFGRRASDRMRYGREA